MSTKVQITVELLEKLAGIRPKVSPKQAQAQRQKQLQQQQQLARLGGPLAGLGGLPPPLHAPHFSRQQQHQHQQQQHEQELQQVIQESKRVGELLLKAGDQELAAVQQQADQLLNKFRSQIKPVPCGPEREAVVACYRQHGQDVLACSGLIDAYYACAQQAGVQAQS